MLGTVQLRNPSWLGLSPGLPEPAAVAAPTGEAVLAALGRTGALTGLRFDHGAVVHFRFEPDDGGPPLFLKLVAGAARARALAEAEAVARWLARHGAPASAGLEGFPRAVRDGLALFAAPYVAGRRLRADAQDLALLGEGLARLHAALRHHPGAPRWEANTQERVADLERVRQRLAAGAATAGPDPAALRRLAAEAAGWPPGRDGGPATPLHGDVNAGNLLVTDAPPALVFLDFEDLVHSVQPPVVELARCIERAVLVQVDEDARALPLGRALLDAYRRAGGVLAGGPDLAAVLRALCLQSLCVLAESAWRDVPVAAAEWRKFFDLDRLAQERAPLLRAML